MVRAGESVTLKVALRVPLVPTVTAGLLTMIVGWPTVTLKVMDVDSLALSVAEIVMMLVPVPAGCNETVRLAPLPPNVKPEAATTLWLLEVAVTAKLATGVLLSPTVKAKAPLTSGSVRF